MSDFEALAVPDSQLAQHAREHYKRISKQACEWHGLIPEAIDAWEELPQAKARIAALEQQLDRALKDENQRIVELFHQLSAKYAVIAALHRQVELLMKQTSREQ